jgi:phosphohistidine phosphatase
MEVYLLRHGIAEDRNQEGDAARVLTDEGRKKLRRVLERAAKAGVSPSLILSSPYKRAVQTAEIAAETLGYKKKIVPTDALLPEASAEAFWEEIRARRPESAILAAGHEPMMSASVAWLLGAPAVQVDMKKAALVSIELGRFDARPQGVLRWMLIPRLTGD